MIHALFTFLIAADVAKIIANMINFAVAIAKNIAKTRNPAPVIIALQMSV